MRLRDTESIDYIEIRRRDLLGKLHIIVETEKDQDRLLGSQRIWDASSMVQSKFKGQRTSGRGS